MMVHPSMHPAGTTSSGFASARSGFGAGEVVVPACAVAVAAVAIEGGLTLADVAEEDAGLAVTVSGRNRLRSGRRIRLRRLPASSSAPSMSPSIRSRTGSGDWER